MSPQTEVNTLIPGLACGLFEDVLQLWQRKISTRGFADALHQILLAESRATELLYEATSRFLISHDPLGYKSYLQVQCHLFLMTISLHLYHEEEHQAKHLTERRHSKIHGDIKSTGTKATVGINFNLANVVVVFSSPL